MFPPADQALSNSCLPPEFSQYYTSYAGLFALVAALSIQFIQTMAIQHFSTAASHNHDHQHNHDHVPPQYHSYELERNPPQQPGHPSVPTRHDSRSESVQPTSHSVRDAHLAKGDTLGGKSTCSTGVDVEIGALAVAANIHSDGCGDAHFVLLGHHAHRRVTAYILEIGVATHSIIIGITLGVTRGAEFTSLIAAISFHQFFEGCGLSTTAMDAGFTSLREPLLMALLYTLTTPIGIGIGIAISNSYNGNSNTALLTQGIFDSVSAGILIYDALVNMITVNITHSDKFMTQTPGQKAGQFVALWLGAGIMSLIGRWA
jgi:ZIP zinc/iron transport family